MGQEFFINSQDLEDKIRKLLPSQGGAGAGFDLSASTQIIPIIDLTESAEGSNLRQDLQRSLSFNQQTAFDISGSTETVITNTGYYYVTAGIILKTRAAGSENLSITLNDGSSDKIIYGFVVPSGADNIYMTDQINFNVFLPAGDSLKIGTSSNCSIRGSFRQIASIDGSLTDPN